MVLYKTAYSLNEIVYYLICIIAFTIFYQQVFVINLGASLKIYEIIAILLLLIYIFKDKMTIRSKLSLYLFFFFCVTPTISYFLYLFNTDKELYYNRFPEAVLSLRTNIYIAPTLLLIYYYFNWIVFNYIASSELIYMNKRKIIRVFIISGSLVSIYNFYAYIFIRHFGFPELIPSFGDFRNASTQITGRFCGFSDEPGSYIVLQTWVVYYLLFCQDILRFKRIWFLRIINILSLLMTFSSMLVPSILIISFMIFRKVKLRYKFLVLIAIVSLCYGVRRIVLNYDAENVIKYIFVEKITNYISGSDNTLDSGAYRNLTAKLGLEVFKDYPIVGCGGGTSCFFLWSHENNMGIRTWGETLTSTTYPQNCYAKILAELGVVGFIFFFIYFILFLRKCKKNLSNSICNVGFYGTITTLIMLLSVYPETSLFLWFNIALTANEIYFISIKTNNNDNQESHI